MSYIMKALLTSSSIQMQSCLLEHVGLLEQDARVVMITLFKKCSQTRENPQAKSAKYRTYKNIRIRKRANVNPDIVCMAAQMPKFHGNITNMTHNAHEDMAFRPQNESTHLWLNGSQTRSCTEERKVRHDLSISERWSCLRYLWWCFPKSRRHRMISCYHQPRGRQQCGIPNSMISL